MSLKSKRFDYLKSRKWVSVSASLITLNIFQICTILMSSFVNVLFHLKSFLFSLKILNQNLFALKRKKKKNGHVIDAFSYIIAFLHHCK